MTFNVTFTGPCNQFGRKTYSREELVALATHVGMRHRPSFCSKTDLVVAPTSKPEAPSKKLASAIENGVKVVTYPQFLHMVKAMVADRAAKDAEVVFEVERSIEAHENPELVGDNEHGNKPELESIDA